MYRPGNTVNHVLALVLLAWQAGDACAATSHDLVASVSTARQLREALQLGMKHVVINQHIDMKDESGAGPSLLPDDGVLAICVPEPGRWNGTQSIRGNCSAPVDLLRMDPPPKAHQCVVTVSGSFINIAPGASPVWLSALYVQIAAPRLQEAVLISTHAADLYLTDITLVGAGPNARGLYVKEDNRVFISGAHFSGFAKDFGAAVLLDAGARATIVHTRFANNTATSAGPTAELCTTRSNGTRIGAAVRFHNCRINEDPALDGGYVSVEDHKCRVYTNSEFLPVWDATLECTLDAWLLRPLTPDPNHGGSGAEQHSVDVFADVEASGRSLPHATDAAFARVVRQQAQLSGLAAPTFRPLPDGTSLRAADPYDVQYLPLWLMLVILLGHFSMLVWGGSRCLLCSCKRVCKLVCMYCGTGGLASNDSTEQIALVTRRGGHVMSEVPQPQGDSTAVQLSKIDGIGISSIP
eukprot:jgi/Ulvmu1/4223/UM019_0202.1